MAGLKGRTSAYGLGNVFGLPESPHPSREAGLEIDFEAQLRGRRTHKSNAHGCKACDQALQRLAEMLGWQPFACKSRAGDLALIGESGGRVMNMENEKFQEIVIEHLIRLTQSDVEIKGELGSIKGELGSVKDELGSVKGELGSVKGELGSVKGELGSVKDQLRNLEAAVLRIENDHGEKLQALIDAYEAQRDVNERADNALQRIDRLELKVSEHDAILRKAR